MKRPSWVVAVVGLAGVGLAVALALLPRLESPDVLNGYVEAERLYLAAPVSGALRRLAVEEGETVRAGQPLFTIDPDQTAADLARAQAGLAAAEALAEDARKGGRPVELAVLEAQAAAARARQEEARTELLRVKALAERGVYAPARLDQAEALSRSAAADLAAAERRRDAAALGARADQIAAAEARVNEAQAGVQANQARLGDLSPVAPSAGLIEQVFYRAGEWTPANQPVVALLPADRVRVRFFVPQDQVAAYRPGRTVRVACDGCPEAQTAQITYVSPRPEFTPPVIYSREARDRLVFMVEARPAAPLPPGLPVDVTPLKPDPVR